MTIREWQERGLADATAGKPYNPPMHGPVMQAYSAGFDQGSNQ
ncbi:hypothetical protein BKA24_001775 [Microbacterium marinum]|uniref:Uncharacterized protein n=1 Tax=Microbacterium marinum TaxID=421115 RepID=A0A7W7BSI6_9MICO|nr:hypothetical protein [Microbacterium marinum]MBB4667066.1 hypothetical protein [Microbacterium marinum]